MLLITTSTHAANVSLVRNLSYDPAKDFTVVGVFRSSGSYLMVRPEAPWRDLPSFVAAAKAALGKLVFGYFNASSRTPPEYLGRLAGIQLQGVPYRAIANAIADLISGEIHCLFMDTTASNQYLQSHQLRPLAITSLTRAAATPDVPAVAETFPGFDFAGWWVLAAPTGVPAVPLVLMLRKPVPVPATEYEIACVPIGVAALSPWTMLFVMLIELVLLVPRLPAGPPAVWLPPRI